MEKPDEGDAATVGNASAIPDRLAFVMEKPDEGDAATVGNASAIPDRLALFLVASASGAVVAALASLLQRHGFVVRIANESAPSVELDYENATFAVIHIAGEGTVEAWSLPLDDGSRVRPPGAYAVIMPGPELRETPDGVGSIQLDARGDWLRTSLQMLVEMGWTA